MKEIPGFENRYAATEDGRIYSIKRHRFLKGEIGRNGYLRVLIDKKHYCVHSLVALAFLGERPENYTVDHIDRDKTNNYPINLRYCEYYINRRNRNDYRGISELSKQTGVNETAIRNGLNKGKTIDEIIEMNKSGYGREKPVIYKGKIYTAKDLAIELGLKRTTLQKRIRDGWPEEDWTKPLNYKHRRKTND